MNRSLVIFVAAALAGCSPDGPPQKGSAVPPPSNDSKVVPKPTQADVPTKNEEKTPAGAAVSPEEQVASVVESLKPHQIHLFVYSFPKGGINLKKGAIDESGHLSPGALTELKKLTPLGLSLDFDGDAVWASDSTLDDLKQFPFFKGMTVRLGPTFSDAGIESLSSMKNVESVALTNTGSSKVTGNGLKALANLKQLRYLRHDIETNGEFLAAFADHPKLAVLTLNEQKLTDEGLSKVEKLLQMEDLTINRSTLNKAGLSFLKSSAALERIRIDRCNQVTDTMVANLAGLQALVKVDLSGTPLLITNSSLETLSQLPALQYLVLTDAPEITDAGIATLSTHPALRSIEIEKCPKLTNSSLVSLAKIPTLTEISIVGSPEINDEGAMQLKSLTNLTSLKLEGSMVTDEGIEKLKAEMPKLQRFTR